MSPTARPIGLYAPRRRLFLLTVLALSSVALAAPGPARGDGFRILDQGAAATAQGAAFAGQADDPSAIHYNPAGMTQLPGVQIYLGANLVSGDTRFTSTSGASTSGGTEGPVSNPPPGQFYVTWSLGGLPVPALREVTLGLGVAAPFGLQVTYPNSGPLANVTTHAALPLLDIKPSIAYRLGPYLSLGAGLDIYTFSSLLGDGQAEQKRIAGPEFALLGIAPGSTVEVNGVDTAVGFNVSALATLIRTGPDEKPRLNVGLVYRSRATLDLSGHFEVNGIRTSRARTEFNLPWILTAAVAAWPVRTVQHEWKLELDVDYVDWTSFKNLDVKLDNGVTLPNAQKWSDTVVIMFGTEWKWLTPSGFDGWEIAARGGYIRSMTPVPRQTFGPTIPDADYNAFSVGLGLHCRAPGRLLGLIPCGGEPARGAKLGVDLSYQAVLYDERRISNNNDPRVNGVWDTTTHVGSISFRLGF